MNAKELRARLEAAKGKRQHARQAIAAEKRLVSAFQLDATACHRAQGILQESARLTQEQLQYRISQLVTLAMEAVFDDPYEVGLEFENSRGKTSASLFFHREGERSDPLGASGGGAVDVAAFGMQVSLWTLQSPRTRNTLILDEPLKFLKGGDLPNKGAEMLRSVSHKLGLQVIMVSHSTELVDSADKVFYVSKAKGISTVK